MSSTGVCRLVFRAGQEIGELIVNGQEPLACRVDLNRFMIRSRRRVG